MQRIILACCLLILTISVQAQSRKQIANFSQHQQYYNPAFTGFEGAVLKSLYRNQWTGFEDAPKTILASAELDLAGIGAKQQRHQLRNRQNELDYLEAVSAKHALGLTLLHDRFGPSKETQASLSYGSGVRLSERLSLRWGTALTYNNYLLDGNSLTLDQENDPKYTHLLGQKSRTSKADLNLGLALSSSKFYLGYAMQDVTKGKFFSSGDDFLEDGYSRKHVVQAGYRTNISDQLGLTINSIYQYDSNEAAILEGQLKAVYQNMFWVGGGYRSDQAYNLTGGVRLSQLSVHYTYETPVKSTGYISKPTNEIGLSYTLRKHNTARPDKQITIW